MVLLSGDHCIGLQLYKFPVKTTIRLVSVHHAGVQRYPPTYTYRIDSGYQRQRSMTIVNQEGDRQYGWVQVLLYKGVDDSAFSGNLR